MQLLDCAYGLAYSWVRQDIKRLVVLVLAFLPVVTRAALAEQFVKWASHCRMWMRDLSFVV